MLLRYASFEEAADLVLKAVDKTIASRRVTRDFYVLMDKDSATELSTSDFTAELIKNM